MLSGLVKSARALNAIVSPTVPWCSSRVVTRMLLSTPLCENGQICTPSHKGVLLDAAGTLLSPSEPSAEVYLRFAAPHGCQFTAREVLQRYRRAYNTPWGRSTIRYVGDARDFWKYIVFESTGCYSEEMFEQIYDYYQQPHAWKLSPGAVEALTAMRANGVKLAVVSNFDTRLKPLLAGLGVAHLFDELVVSAEVGVEKPNPVIFEAAVIRLGLQPDEVVHVGDDRRNDLWGARDAGILAWLWGSDVRSFPELANRVLYGIDPLEDEHTYQ